MKIFKNIINIILTLAIFGWMVPSIINPVINFIKGTPSEGLMDFSTYSLGTILILAVVNTVTSENKFKNYFKNLFNKKSMVTKVLEKKKNKKDCGCKKKD